MGHAKPAGHASVAQHLNLCRVGPNLLQVALEGTIAIAISDTPQLAVLVVVRDASNSADAHLCVSTLIDVTPGTLKSNAGMSAPSMRANGR